MTIEQEIADFEKNQFDQEQDRLAVCEELDKDYPGEYRINLITPVLEESLLAYDRIIGKYRKKYTEQKTFKDKKDYYNTTLQVKEQGYIDAKNDIAQALKGFIPRPHSDWVTPYDYRMMEEIGYDTHFKNKTLLAETYKIK